ncbi:MAG: alpha/beta hydrolase [Thermoguttaceae bacterium]|nr:alpha/beta hydrolase [Thermoguttaceae bacterium]
MKNGLQHFKVFLFCSLVFCIAMYTASTAVLAAGSGSPAKQAKTPLPQSADANETINIWPQGAWYGPGMFEKVEVKLHVFLPDATKATGQGVIICPGGGYRALCIVPEGYKIAKWLNAHGIAGFVLEYRLPDGRPFVPLADAGRAIRYVRANAERFHVRTQAIGIIGFSAGGHLASTAVTHFDQGRPNDADPIRRVSSRPDFGILIYPVVTLTDKTHAGTKNNLLGKNQTEEMIIMFSNEKQVGPDTPPVFLAHAVDDRTVPIVNSTSFVDSMKKFGRSVRYVELANGGHGLNGYKGPSWDKWQAECIQWLGEQNTLNK